LTESATIWGGEAWKLFPQGTRAQAFIDAADRSWRQKLVVLPKVWAEILGMNATLLSNLPLGSS